MIIQCEQCETTYRFDSAKLQNGEAQVRCVRCGNVFTLDTSSDLGEAFLDTEVAQNTQTTGDHGISPASVTTGTSGTFVDSPQEQPSNFPFDSTPATGGASAQQPDFSMDNTTEQEQEEEDFWTSPGEFSLDTHEGDTESARDQANSREESGQTPDSAPNEFIFEPLEEEEDSGSIAEQAEDQHTPAPAAEESPAMPKKKKTKKSGSKLLLVVLLIILIGAGIYAYYFVAHGITSAPDLMHKVEAQINQLLNPQPEPTGPSINIRSGDNFYISNDNLGSLFVINGTVTNISNQPQGEIAVEATLFASDGTPLRSTTTFCGNPISREQLRSETWEGLQEQMSNKLGAGLSNVSVQPGESIPFSVVFHNLPENFAEFSISEAKAAANVN